MYKFSDYYYSVSYLDTEHFNIKSIFSEIIPFSLSYQGLTFTLPTCNINLREQSYTQTKLQGNQELVQISSVKAAYITHGAAVWTLHTVKTH